MPRPLRQGDTFLFGPASIPAHLCVIISDPHLDDEVVVVVSVTTARRFVDNACLLDIGDHPLIKHPSFVFFREARAFPKGFVQTLKPMEPLDSGVLARVIAGAAVSKFLAIEHYDFLEAQGLFDDLP